MPLHPSEYAEILKRKIVAHGTDCWLVNTGWSGGGYGIGSRMPISATRLIVDKIHDGSLASCETTLHAPTGFQVPVCDELPLELMNPEASWTDLSEYMSQANTLMKLFLDKSKSLG